MIVHFMVMVMACCSVLNMLKVIEFISLVPYQHETKIDPLLMFFCWQCL